jgi:cell division protein FtsL
MARHLIPPNRRHIASSIMWGTISVLFGWSLFAWWWSRVVVLDQPRPLIRLVMAVLLFSVVVLAATFVWIWHNRRIARRGTRGVSTRYRVPAYQRDALGREICLPNGGLVQTARVVVIEAHGERKIYRAEGQEAS